MSTTIFASTTSFVPSILRKLPTGSQRYVVRYAATSEDGTSGEEHLLAQGSTLEECVSRIADLLKAAKCRKVHLHHVQLLNCQKRPGRKVLWEMSHDSMSEDELREAVRGLRANVYIHLITAKHDEWMICGDLDEARTMVAQAKRLVVEKYRLSGVGFTVRQNGALVADWNCWFDED